MIFCVKRLLEAFALGWMLVLATIFASAGATQGRAEIEIVPNLGPNDFSTIAVSPDGQHVVAGGRNSLSLWDAASGRLIRTLSSDLSVKTAAFSPNGGRLIQGGYKDLRLWDTASGQLIRRFEGLSDWVFAATLSADGRLLRSSGYNGLIHLWDVASGQLIMSVRRDLDRPPGGPAVFLQTEAFSPDGKQLLSGYSDGSIKLWNAESGKLIHALSKQMPDPRGRVAAVAFSPDGSHLLSSTTDQKTRKTTLELWDSKGGQLTRVFAEQLAEVTSVAFSPDGTKQLSGSSDGTFGLWNVTSGQLIRKKALKRYQAAVAFSPDGRSLFSAIDQIQQWDVESGELIRSFGLEYARITTVALASTGAHLISGDSDGTLKLWDGVSGALIRATPGHSEEVTSVAFAPNAQQLLSGSRDKTLRLWDAATGQLAGIVDASSGEVFSVAFSPDGTRLLSGHKDETIKLWDAAHRELLRTIRGPSDAVAFSPDGERVLSAGGHAVPPCEVCDPKREGLEVCDRKFGGRRGRGQRRTYCERKLKLWDTRSGELIHTFSGVGGEGGQGSSVAFSPDGARILSGDTIFGALELWDAKSGELIRTMHSTGGAVASVAFSPDGTRLVSGGFHNTPKLWDARSGQLIQTLNGHLRGVRSVMFSGNGARLISGGEDGTIRIWKASTGELLASLIAVKDGEWIAVTPEGFFQGSANGAKMLSVVRGLEVHGGERFQEVLHRPDLVREKLAGDPVGRVRQAAATLDLAKLMKNSARP